LSQRLVTFWSLALPKFEDEYDDEDEDDLRPYFEAVKSLKTC
jgi:hypothetical protein